jgi:hypothetical protein
LEDKFLNTRGELIRWWEERRSHFNLVVVAVGFASLVLVFVAGSAAVKPGSDFVEPLIILPGTALYLALANICYTLGWVVDTTLYDGRPRTRLYKSGVVFAVFPHRSSGRLGCDRMASHYPHRAEARLIGWRNIPISLIGHEKTTPPFRSGRPLSGFRMVVQCRRLLGHRQLACRVKM